MAGATTSQRTAAVPFMAPGAARLSLSQPLTVLQVPQSAVLANFSRDALCKVPLNPEPQTRNPKTDTRKPTPETRNPSTRNPKLETRDPKP